MFNSQDSVTQYGQMFAMSILSLLPIYFLDCMDGHGLTRCSLPMIVRAGLTAGQQCGDLGWQPQRARERIARVTPDRGAPLPPKQTPIALNLGT